MKNYKKLLPILVSIVFIFQIAHPVFAEKKTKIYISGYPDDFYLSYPALPLFTPIYKGNNITLIFKKYYTRAVIYIDGKPYIPTSPFIVEIKNFYGVGTPFILHAIELLTGIYPLPIIGGLTFIGVGEITIITCT